jgi:hypothetical protein
MSDRYIIGSAFYGRIVEGSNFKTLVRELISRHPLIQPARPENSNVLLHPTTLLVALVATALLKTGEADAHAAAGDLAHGAVRGRPGEGTGASGSASLFGSVTLEPKHVAVVLSAVMLVGASTVEPGDDEVSTAAGPVSEAPDAVPVGAPLKLTEYAKADVDSQLRPEPDAIGPDEAVAEVGHGEMGRVAGLPLAAGEVVALLSLLAVLSDLARAPDVAADGRPPPMWQPTFEFAGTAVDVATHRHTMVAASDDGSSSEAGNKAIVVNLVAKGTELPAVEGLSLGPKLASEASSGSGSTPNLAEVVSKLPALLQPHLAEGIHLNVQGTSANDVLLIFETGGKALQSQLPGGQQAALAGSSFSLTQTDDAVGSVDAGSATVDPVADLSTTDAAAQGPPSLLDPSDAIEAAVQQFIAGTSDYKIILVENDIVFYDVAAVHDGDKSLKTVTWDFSDGSSISLVGLAANLPHELIA